MSTAKKIQEIRKNKGISQYKLAYLTKSLNQSQVSKIEKGYRKITETDLREISEALKVPISDLIDQETNDREMQKV